MIELGHGLWDGLEELARSLDYEFDTTTYGLTKAPGLLQRSHSPFESTAESIKPA
jgi:hypothetical protein